MKITLEIETTDSCPDIVRLVSEVITHAIKDHGKVHDYRVGDNNTPMDGTVMAALKELHATALVDNVTEGSMQYATAQAGPIRKLTFRLTSTRDEAVQF